MQQTLSFWRQVSLPLFFIPAGNMYSDHVYYIIRYHRSMLHLQCSKAVLNVSTPLKTLIDSVFNNLSIRLRASLPVILNLTNTVHLHYESISASIASTQLDLHTEMFFTTSIYNCSVNKTTNGQTDYIFLYSYNTTWSPFAKM